MNITPGAWLKENMVYGLGQTSPHQSVTLRRVVDRRGAMHRVRCNCQNCVPIDVICYHPSHRDVSLRLEDGAPESWLRLRLLF